MIPNSTSPAHHAYPAISILFLLALAACYLDEKVANFRSFYDEIEVGMSVLRVDQLFNENFPSADQNGWPVAGQSVDGDWFTLDPRSAEYNSEIIQVVFEGGAVASKTYLPD